jgi:parvulin-like peptidyl-prolyl isomerase
MTTLKSNLIATAGICSLLLSACSQHQGTPGAKTVQNPPAATTAPAPSTATATSTAATDATTAAAPTGSNATTADTTTGSAALPQGQVHINLTDLPDSLIVCNVGSYPLSIGEYRTALKVQQVAVQSQLETDPQLRANALAISKQNNITLTPEERKKLIDAARQAHGAGLADYLKSKHLTQSDFENAVADEGAEFKVAEAQIEQELLGQLVRRAMLAQAASKSGLSKQAQENVAKVEASDQFKHLQTQTGLSKDNLRTELLQTELARLQLLRVVDAVKISDKELRQLYDKNKNALKHDERIRLSSILIAAPDKDFANIKSVRTQVHDMQPKLAGKDLDKAVETVEAAQQNKALIILTEARLPKADFAKLANQNTQDAGARMKQNGGDMGWSDKKSLVPAFYDAVKDLPAGQVVPKLVKTDEGYRIVKITSKEKAGTMSMLEVKPALVANLKDEKAGKVVQEWLAKQQPNMPVKFTDKFLALAKQKSPTQ